MFQRTLLSCLASLVFASVCLADVTGQWTGFFEFKGDGGETRQAPVLLILKQEGSKVTGTGGRDEQDRHEVLKGTVEGDVVTLEVEAGGAPIQLKMVLKGDELTGDVSRERPSGEKQTAKVSVKRAK